VKNFKKTKKNEMSKHFIAGLVLLILVIIVCLFLKSWGGRFLVLVVGFILIMCISDAQDNELARSNNPSNWCDGYFNYLEAIKSKMVPRRRARRKK